MPSENDIPSQIHDIVRAIPSGFVLAYGEVGARCEPPISGYICGRFVREIPEDVPWWRVVGKGGNLPIRKRSPQLSIEQRRLLEAEGVGFDNDGRVRAEYFLDDSVPIS